MASTAIRYGCPGRSTTHQVVGPTRSRWLGPSTAGRIDECAGYPRSMRALEDEAVVGLVDGQHPCQLPPLAPQLVELVRKRVGLSHSSHSAGDAAAIEPCSFAAEIDQLEILPLLHNVSPGEPSLGCELTANGPRPYPRQGST